MVEGKEGNFTLPTELVKYALTLYTCGTKYLSFYGNFTHSPSYYGNHWNTFPIAIGEAGSAVPGHFCRTDPWREPDLGRVRLRAATNILKMSLPP